MTFSRLRLIVLLIAACVGARSARAQARLDVRVTSVSGRSVYINAGRRAGVAPGARLVIVRTDGSRIEATIIDVTASSSRAELPPEVGEVPAVDDRGEVDVISPEPEPQPEPAPGEPPPATPPEHPPWQRREEERAPDTPLLAPAFATAPKDRPMSVHGRVYTSIRGTRDIENDSTYSFARLDTWLEVKNPFHDAGRILFAGDMDFRGTSLVDGDRNDSTLRIQRFSYARGLDEHAPYRFELGRFYSATLPEIGTIDGAEGMIRFASGWSFGGGLGFYPIPTDYRDSGEDYGFHAFADYAPLRDRSLAATLGYQQTWHNGRPDRNALYLKANARPGKHLWLSGLAIVDLYGEDDTAKDSLDLTQGLLQATYTPGKKTGLTLALTRTTWPELKRDEYVGIPDRILRDGYVDRVSLSGWRKVAEDVRLSARVHAWQDQDDTGHGGEVGVDWTNAFSKRSTLSASVYSEQSAWAPGYGLRAQATHDFAAARLLVGYDLFVYSLDSVAGSEDFARHTLRTDVGFGTGRWSADVDLSYSFGDNENAVTLGVYLQRRF